MSAYNIIDHKYDVLVIGAGGSGTDPGFEVSDFKKLAEGSGIQLYGGFDSLGRQETKRLVSHADWRDAWIRASAARYYDQGADGVYTFNWFPGKEDWSGLLNTLGSPQTLRGMDKIYTSLHRGPTYLVKEKPNAVNDRIRGETSVVLYPTITGDGPTFTVGLHDDLNSDPLKSIELHIELEHWAPEDRVQVALDGEILPPPSIRDVAEEDDNDPADVAENKWFVWGLSPNQAA